MFHKNPAVCAISSVRPTMEWSKCNDLIFSIDCPVYLGGGKRTCFNGCAWVLLWTSWLTKHWTLCYHCQVLPAELCRYIISLLFYFFAFFCLEYADCTQIIKELKGCFVKTIFSTIKKRFYYDYCSLFLVFHRGSLIIFGWFGPDRSAKHTHPSIHPETECGKYTVGHVKN